MKTKLLAFATLLAAAATSAAPLTAPTAVHTKPDAKSPTISLLKAGSEPIAATSVSAVTPPNWMAVDLPGKHVAYVQNKDLTKSMDVAPGSLLYLQPRLDGGVLVAAEQGDKINIDGILGKWARITLDKTLTGYIQVAQPAAPLPAIATATAVAPSPAAAAKPVPTAQPPAPAMAPSPVAPVAYGVTTAGQPAPVANLSDGAAGALPRLFPGVFVSTRRPLAPRRPYDWALNDNAGKRYAYLDVSKLLQIEQIEKYVDHTVVVYGAAKATPDGKDFVIQVESLQLK